MHAASDERVCSNATPRPAQAPHNARTTTVLEQIRILEARCQCSGASQGTRTVPAGVSHSPPQLRASGYCESRTQGRERGVGLLRLRPLLQLLLLDLVFLLLLLLHNPHRRSWGCGLGCCLTQALVVPPLHMVRYRLLEVVLCRHVCAGGGILPARTSGAGCVHRECGKERWRGPRGGAGPRTSARRRIEPAPLDPPGSSALAGNRETLGRGLPRQGHVVRGPSASGPG